MSDQKIADALGVDLVRKDEIVDAEVTPIPVQPATVQDDFEQSRQVLQYVVGMGAEAIKEALDLAKQSQNVEGYESLASLITAVTRANNQLLDLHRKKQALEEKSRVVEQPKTENHTHNNLVITTAELQKLLTKVEVK